MERGAITLELPGMKISKKWLFLLGLIPSTAAISQKAFSLSSPDGRIQFSFRLANQRPEYSLRFAGQPVIDYSPLGLSFMDAGDWDRGLKLEKAIFRDSAEDYTLFAGKTSRVHDPYRELMVRLRQSASPFRQIEWQVRAFNSGVAFRYRIPEQTGWPSFTLTDENTSFQLAGNPMVHALILPNYTSSHEGEYTHVSWNDLKEDTLMDMPTLFEWPGKLYLAITEAQLVDFAGMYLVKHDHVLRSRLSPLPGQDLIKVKADLPHSSSWRVLLVSDRIGALIEANLITDLNEPCRVSDLSWLKPGKTTFPWWNGNVTPDTLNAPGNNFVTQQYYIDFCARNGLAYHTVVEYGLHQWYMDDGVNFQPGPHSDVTTPVPGLDMKQVCDYAHQHGVGIRVWVHWAALYPKLDTAFALFEKWGISGMMVDFMDRDDQIMVNIQEEILRKAAQHHLHIQFHGAFKPTGRNRVWPNELTREGTLNYEANKWSTRMTADHDISMPFTRMLAGSTDYHLGGFRAVPDDQFVIQYTRPLMMGTRCHMLAMYVVLENYLAMVCDYPAAYEGQPGFDFICQVPTIWDETRVLDAGVCRYITIARRKGTDWYLGSITNHEGRRLAIALDFLPPGNFVAEMYHDAPDVHENPNHLTRETRQVSRGDTLQVDLAPGGGQVIHLHPK
jgi:alpha-glucosidase